MRRVFITKHLKNFILLISAFTAFIVITSLLIVGVGVGNNKSTDKKDYGNEFEINESSTKYVSLPKIFSVKVFMSKQNASREINLEEYVTGVVASEMPAAFDVEALKAQAVAARTYALAHVTKSGGVPCKNGKGADLCDTVHCQVYKSKEERIKLWASKKLGEVYWKKIKMAVESTSGQVLTYNGKLVMEPYYFATSSGKTENSEDVFSSSIPYLKSVESPGEERAGSFKSSNNFKYSELSRIINNNYNNANVSLANIKKGIKVIERSDAGSVKTIKVGSITMTGSKFRTMLGLKSSNFEIVFNLNDIKINCSGYGHGVGMSQWGADAMAKSGKSYIEILNHYYMGTDISK